MQPVYFLRLVTLILFTFVQIIPTSVSAYVRVRIKDIVSVEGVRGNQLVGYGLVVGLNGSGDTIGSTAFTRESLASMLERLGVNVRDNTGAALLNGKNVAAVMVTGTLPAFARQGSKIDVNVSALGDAKDLRGGTLLVTPLLAADGQVYAVGQGPVAVGGFKAEGQAASVTKGVPTAGRIASGAIVEKEIGFELASMNSLKFSLNNPDFTTAKRVADRINHTMGNGVAAAKDPSTIQVEIPGGYKGRTVEFMTMVEQLDIQPDQVAKIVVDDHDGIIVMGANVRISTVAISHGSITIRVTEHPEVSQPNPFIQSNPMTLNANAS
ncbi:MAG: flagellar basal body P-ring protein FlgI, partial [Alphaproteobacteria bacterium]|nr:flagellar basal body P-ring protein FlgI [Alphaproteobacteria bacterium]